jgi:hypothetical protein
MCRGAAQLRGADDETALFHAECRAAVRVQARHEAQAAAMSNPFRSGGIRRQLQRAQHLVDTVQTFSRTSMTLIPFPFRRLPAGFVSSCRCVELAPLIADVSVAMTASDGTPGPP